MSFFTVKELTTIYASSSATDNPFADPEAVAQYGEEAAQQAGALTVDLLHALAAFIEGVTPIAGYDEVRGTLESMVHHLPPTEDDPGVDTQTLQQIAAGLASALGGEGTE